jgi:hypothetical protein
MTSLTFRLPCSKALGAAAVFFTSLSDFIARSWRSQCTSHRPVVPTLSGPSITPFCAALSKTCSILPPVYYFPAI